MSDIPFLERPTGRQCPARNTKASQGSLYWRTVQCGAIRVRMGEHTPGYVADHWCTKGHIHLRHRRRVAHEPEDGRTFSLTPGMSYQVADDAEPHRSSDRRRLKLFIVD